MRDLRLRWACEEAGLSYAIRSIPFDDREPNHLARQPIGQRPYLNDRGLEGYAKRLGFAGLAPLVAG